MSEPFRQPDPDETLPENLRRDLLQLHAAPQVTPEIDRAVAALFAQENRRRWRTRWLFRTAAAAGTAAAAAAVLFLVLHPPFAAVSPAPAWTYRTAPQGDILDAFCVAKQLDSGARPGPQWDANGDGTVDRRDVDAWAAAAVSLKRGS